MYRSYNFAEKATTAFTLGDCMDDNQFLQVSFSLTYRGKLVGYYPYKSFINSLHEHTEPVDVSKVVNSKSKIVNLKS